MNNRQSSILIGSMLGDGSVNKSGGITLPASNKHLDYLEWKHKELKSLGAGQITTYSRLDKRYNRVYTTCRFYIGGLKELRHRFYPNGEKLIPLDLKLDPLAFAVWFLDDGTLICRSSFGLATCGFSQSCLEYAIQMLKAIGLTAKISKGNRIYLGAQNKWRIIEYVSPIMVPSMVHKLDVRTTIPLVGKVVKTCPICDVEFETYESDKRTYCGPECGIAGKLTGYATRTKMDVCPLCGREFLRYSRKQQTCVPCRDKPFPHEICRICDKPVKTRGRVYCSPQCSVIGCHIAQGHKISPPCQARGLPK